MSDRSDQDRATGGDEDLRQPKRADSPPGNAAKDTNEWVTGDEPMTGAQASYLKTLSQEVGVDFDPELSKAEASERIDDLQERAGRG